MSIARARRRTPTWALVAVLSAVLIASLIGAVMVGPVPLAPGEVVGVILGRLGLAPPSDLTPAREAIVWDLRVQRAFLAAIVGAGLAVVGAVMQAVSREPLADPYLLGMSSGASAGAVVVVVLGFAASVVGLAGGAFLGAAGAFTAALVLAGRGSRHLSPARLVLAGVAVAFLCSALTSLITLTSADAQAIRGLLFWLLGTLSGARAADVLAALVVLVPVVAVCLAHARPLDAMTFGDDTAASVGVRVERSRWLLLGATALLTGVMVALCGVIGFVGLIIPHAMRLLGVRTHGRLLPLAALGGACFLVWMDTLARTLLDPRELPVGILTALFGVPVFMVLLWRRGDR